MKEHFLKIDRPENRIRYIIFQLMTHFEEMFDELQEMLLFARTEEMTKDLLENHFIDMEQLHAELGTWISKLGEQSPLHEPIRRTYNHLKGLNHIDLDQPNWAKVASMALPDKIYYRQIKLMVFTSEER